jgi:hypothetical protein
MIDIPGDSDFWFGVVEDRDDPLFLGRVRVRILGKHSLSLSDIPTECLPWAHTILPTTSCTVSGIGISPTGILPGTWVCGSTKGSYLFVHGILPGFISEQMKKAFREDINVDDDQSETGGRDVRNEESLEKEPRAGLASMAIQEGKGDAMGVVGEDNPPQQIPLEKNYEVEQIAEMATDANPIATNNKKVIKKTLVGYKSIARDQGGILDGVTLIGIFPCKEFFVGIRENRGTSKVNCVYTENVRLKSTNFPSVFSNYAAVKEDPTNSNGEPVYKESPIEEEEE